MGFGLGLAKLCTMFFNTIFFVNDLIIWPTIHTHTRTQVEANQEKLFPQVGANQEEHACIHRKACPYYLFVSESSFSFMEKVPLDWPRLVGLSRQVHVLVSIQSFQSGLQSLLLLDKQVSLPSSELKKSSHTRFVNKSPSTGVTLVNLTSYFIRLMTH